MSHVGWKLIEHGVERYPIAEPDFGPGVIVERAAQVNHADHGFRWDACGPGQRVEQHRVFVAVAFSGLKDFKGIGNADRRLFGDFLVNPVFDFQRGSECIGFTV